MKKISEIEHALDELSRTTVHDLSAALHVINFCAEQLRDEPARRGDERYLQNLATNAQRATELFNSLRSRLKELSKN